MVKYVTVLMLAPRYENVMSSKKPEVLNVIEKPSHVVRQHTYKNLVETSRVVFASYANGQTDQQTNR